MSREDVDALRAAYEQFARGGAEALEAAGLTWAMWQENVEIVQDVPPLLQAVRQKPGLPPGASNGTVAPRA